jgi:hypothetical protein
VRARRTGLAGVGDPRLGAADDPLLGARIPVRPERRGGRAHQGRGRRMMGAIRHIAGH